MFGLSFWEIALILAVALIVFGPSKLPELARSLGKGLREFRRATEDFKSSIDAEVRRPDTPPPKAVADKKAEALPEGAEADAELVPETDKPAPAPAVDAVPRASDATSEPESVATSDEPSSTQEKSES